jgi:hypothetical protein
MPIRLFLPLPGFMHRLRRPGDGWQIVQERAREPKHIVGLIGSGAVILGLAERVMWRSLASTADQE